MDYGRLFLFMTAATLVAALSTHAAFWLYGIVRRSVLHREALKFVNGDRLFLQALAKDDGDANRATAKPYSSYSEFHEAVRSGVPLDEILDRCNGTLPDKDELPGPNLPLAMGIALISGIGVFLNCLIEKTTKDSKVCSPEEAAAQAQARQKLSKIQAHMNKGDPA